MRVAISTDMLEGFAPKLRDELAKRGHDVTAFGAFDPDARSDWAWASETAARAVAEGAADQAIICCWTGTGASIAANKVDGIRAALCRDAVTAEGARKWNDANVLALSLQSTDETELAQILDAWFTTPPSTDPTDTANIAHVDEI